MAGNYSRHTLKWTCSKCFNKPLCKKQFDDQKEFKSHLMEHNPPHQKIKFPLEKETIQIETRKEKNLQELKNIMKTIQISNKQLVSQIKKNQEFKKQIRKMFRAKFPEL